MHSRRHVVATGYKPIEYDLEPWVLLYCMSSNEGFQERHHQPRMNIRWAWIRYVIGVSMRHKCLGIQCMYSMIHTVDTDCMLEVYGMIFGCPQA